VTPLKAIDRFTSLTIIGMTKIMCNTSAEVLGRSSTTSFKEGISHYKNTSTSAQMILCIVLLQVQPIPGLTQRDTIVIYQLISSFFQNSSNDIRTLPHRFEFPSS
jgi:hypothetical protein